MIEGVGIERIPNQSYPIGTAYIIIPSDVDRDDFINTCYRKERVSIMLDGGGGTINNCPIDRATLQQILFPADFKSLGSCVVYVSNKFSNQPIIIATISKLNESQILHENSFKKVVKEAGGIVSIEGKAKGGDLFINLESDFENGGSCYITLKSKNNTSKFNLRVFGDMNIYSEGEVTLETLKKVKMTSSFMDGNYKKVASTVELSQDGLKYEDKNENSVEISGEEVNIKPKTKLNVFEGSSPMVLGDKLKSELEKSKKRIDDIIQSLQIATKLITTEVPFQTSLTASLAAITDNEDYGDINSDKSFLD